jgi:MEDS: MEthanogen/methylotroph, DcmR Sensory domain
VINETRTPFQGNAEEISKELRESERGSHFLIEYPDLPTLREMYSHYVRSAVPDDNEIVVVLPFYETTDNVRRILSEDSARIDVRRYEKEQRLLIMDSLKGYFGSVGGLMPFVKQTVDFAKNSGRENVSVIGDMGPFFHYGKENDLVEYEMQLPRKFDMNLKGLCLYHERDFARFSEVEKQQLLKHHNRILQLSPSPVDS